MERKGRKNKWPSHWNQRNYFNTLYLMINNILFSKYGILKLWKLDSVAKYISSSHFQRTQHSSKTRQWDWKSVSHCHYKTLIRELALRTWPLHLWGVKEEKGTANCNQLLWPIAAEAAKPALQLDPNFPRWPIGNLNIDCKTYLSGKSTNNEHQVC